MASVSSSPYDLRIQEYRSRVRHPVRRRLLNSLAAQRTPFNRIIGLMEWLGALMAECERTRTHGALPLAFARGLLSRRTFDRYLPILLAQVDTKGGHDFYIREDTLFISRLRCDEAHRLRAEARWAERRRYERDKKRAQRARKVAQTAQAAPNRMPQTPPSEASCEMSPRPTLFESRETRKTEDKSFDQLLEEAAARAEAVEHECSQGQEVEAAPMTSAEITEAAYREILAEREAEPVQTLVVVPPLRGQLTKWGYRADLAARHRFTDNELALAVEKVERARTPLGNRAGAVVATILKWRRGQWSRAA